MAVINIEMAVGRNEPFDKVLRIFKRKVNESGIIQEVRDNTFYEKPSDKRRKKRQMAVRKQKFECKMKREE